MRLLFDPESEVTDEEGTTALGVAGQPPHQEEEGDAFDATRDTLIRLVSEYWHEQQESAPSGQLTDTIDEFILTHVLEYRHHGTVDGRLALWRQEHVRAVLLEWLPRHVTVLPDEAAEHDAPAAVAALVDFLAAAGVLDPRSDDPGRLRTLAKELRSAHEEAMQDPRFMGPAKFWMLTAARNGVDVRNKRALDRFLADARARRVPYGEEQLAQVMENQFTGFFGRALDTGAGPGGRSLLQERALPLPVVVLGEEEELRRTAAGSGLLGQLDEVARWLGTEGRSVTKTGRLKVADALALARHLGTDRGRGEAAGPLIHLAGDTLENIRRADQLPMLRLLVDWARQARLIRVYRGRLVAVAGARAVREDPLALAARALTALPELRDPLLMGPVWDVPSDLYPRFDLLLTDVLATLYGMPAAMPWPLLWQSVRDSYLGDDGWFATPEARQASHRRSAAELHAVMDLLAEVGMVTFERGTPAAWFHESLRDLNEPEHPEPADASDLSDDSDGSEDLVVRDDVELVRLTELGTYAVRALLTSLDRSAPAVGDLRDADAPTLCAALLDEYDPASARAELAEWIAARGATPRTTALPAPRTAAAAGRRTARRTRARIPAHPALRGGTAPQRTVHGTGTGGRRGTLRAGFRRAGCRRRRGPGRRGSGRPRDRPDRRREPTADERDRRRGGTAGAGGPQQRRRRGVRHHARRGARLRPPGPGGPGAARPDRRGRSPQQDRPAGAPTRGRRPPAQERRHQEAQEAPLRTMPTTSLKVEWIRMMRRTDGPRRSGLCARPLQWSKVYGTTRRIAFLSPTRQCAGRPRRLGAHVVA
ncbi:hypothetical protein ABZT51_26910 [Streptomyces sp. NPDC005373]|uniref:hypothetical protein n=1 Tax=Streptomyces sp. NPDC005373 TaxID=3156879 RepID=UPI0033B1735B